MAKARRTKVEITKRVEGVELTLTTGEADFLLAVLAKIGGPRTGSPRKYADAIKAALQKATGLDYCATDAFPLASGGILFSSYGTAVRPVTFGAASSPFDLTRI